MKTVEYWFDYTCPYAYLGSTQIEAIAARTGAKLVWRPLLLGGVFEAVGTPQKLFATLSPAKAKHNAEDLERWAKHFGVPLKFPAGHPVRSVDALRATIASGCDPKVIHAFYRAYWVENRDPLVGGEFVATQEQKDVLRANTDEAISRGVFGVPAMFVDGEMFWGQDRLDEVEDALSAGSSPPTSSSGVRGGRHTDAPVELYWDFSSPWSYLGTEQVKGWKNVTWKPILLGGLFRSIGQVDAPMLAMGQAKQRYTMLDLERTARKLGVPFRFPSRFPIRSVELLRIWLALPEAQRDAFRAAAMRAIWAEDRDVSDSAVVRSLIPGDADAVLARVGSPDVKDALRANTEEAQKRGVFGVPTYVVDGKDLYWGQDRIPLFASSR